MFIVSLTAVTYVNHKWQYEKHLECQSTHYTQRHRIRVKAELFLFQESDQLHLKAVDVFDIKIQASKQLSTNRTHLVNNHKISWHKGVKNRQNRYNFNSILEQAEMFWNIVKFRKLSFYPAKYMQDIHNECLGVILGFSQDSLDLI